MCVYASVCGVEIVTIEDRDRHTHTVTIEDRDRHTHTVTIVDKDRHTHTELIAFFKIIRVPCKFRIGLCLQEKTFAHEP